MATISGRGRGWFAAGVWAACALAACPASANDNTLVPGKTYTLANTFVLWVPDGIPKLRGVYLNQEAGSGPDHNLSVIGKIWKFAILGYGDMNAGPVDKATMDGLFSQAAQASGHPELSAAPFVAYGNSRNGYFPPQLAGWYPNRCIAYCNALSNPDVGGTSIPRLWHVEEGRSGDAIPNMPQDMSAWRKNGDLLAYVPQWGWGHGTYSIIDMMYPFFDECIRLRLQPDGSLKSLDAASGYLGDPSTWNGEWPKVYKYSEYPGDKSLASWLPSARLAAIWQAYVSKSPTLTNQTSAWGTKHNGGSGGSFLSLSAPPSVCTNTPMRPYDLDKIWGAEYFFAPLDTAIKVAVTQPPGYDGIQAIAFLDGDQPVAAPPVSPLKIWTVPYTLSGAGVRSMIVHLTLAGGQMVTSRPATFFVDPDRSVPVAIRPAARSARPNGKASRPLWRSGDGRPRDASGRSQAAGPGIRGASAHMAAYSRANP